MGEDASALARVLEELRDMRTEQRELRDKVIEMVTRMEDVPDLKVRVSALEKWKWGMVGAMLASGSSLAISLGKVLGA